MGPIERILRDAAELYKEHGYAGPDLAIDEFGDSEDPNSKSAYAWCAFGSLRVAAGERDSEWAKASNILEYIRCNTGPAPWDPWGRIPMPNEYWDEAIECAATGEAEGWL